MQADFSYAPTCDSAGMQLGVTIIADRAAIADWLRDDVEAAGMRVLHCCSFGEFAAADIAALGELVLVDCAALDAAALATLARLDSRLARSGTPCIAATSLAALDAVFGSFCQSNAQILVDPCRAERVVAVGRALAEVPNLRLRELAEEDRLMLLRLTEQVGRIAQRIEGIGGKGEGGGAFRFNAPGTGWRAEGEDYTLATRKVRMPDPALVRRIIKARQARARFFDGDPFADPAWDILLDLTAARAEGARVCVTSLCIAAGVPATTALRWIAQMVEAGLLIRVQDPEDRRRAFIALSDDAAQAMAGYFASLGADAELLAA